MQLYLMRHGDAVPRAENPDRPLSKKGRKQIRTAAKALRKLGVSFDGVVTSTKKRAEETAIVCAEEFEFSSRLILKTDQLKPSGNVRKAYKQVAARYDEEDAILITGHLPSLEGLCSYLLAETGDVAVDFAKSGVCLIEVDDVENHRGSLVWSLAPEHLALIAGCL